MGAFTSKRKEASFEGEEITFDHFQVLRAIGKGSFGKVCIVQKRDSKQMFAMKYMNKEQCKAREALHNVFREIEILSSLNHPFLVNLWFSFQDSEDMFMVVDLLLGGDLRYHVQQGVTFTDQSVRLYILEVASALSYLHSRHIIHRDIKPDNLLLDEEGHVHLTDFNIATVLRQGQLATSMSGTKPYMAPEVFECAADTCEGYDYSVDWWSLGVTAYEVRRGKRPYDIHSNTSLHEIRHLFLHLPKFPGDCHPGLVHLISRLLTVSPDKRLRSLEEVWAESYVANLPLDDVLQKRCRPPFTPPKDHLNCDPTFELEEMIIESRPLHKKKKRLSKQKSLREMQGSLTGTTEGEEEYRPMMVFNREVEEKRKERERREQEWQAELEASMELSDPTGHGSSFSGSQTLRSNACSLGAQQCLSAGAATATPEPSLLPPAPPHDLAPFTKNAVSPSNVRARIAGSPKERLRELQADQLRHGDAGSDSQYSDLTQSDDLTITGHRSPSKSPSRSRKSATKSPNQSPLPGRKSPSQSPMLDRRSPMPGHRSASQSSMPRHKSPSQSPIPGRKSPCWPTSRTPTKSPSKSPRCQKRSSSCRSDRGSSQSARSSSRSERSSVSKSPGRSSKEPEDRESKRNTVNSSKVSHEAKDGHKSSSSSVTSGQDMERAVRATTGGGSPVGIIPRPVSLPASVQHDTTKIPSSRSSAPASAFSAYKSNKDSSDGSDSKFQSPQILSRATEDQEKVDEINGSSVIARKNSYRRPVSLPMKKTNENVFIPGSRSSAPSSAFVQYTTTTENRDLELTQSEKTIDEKDQVLQEPHISSDTKVDQEKLKGKIGVMSTATRKGGTSILGRQTSLPASHQTESISSFTLGPRSSAPPSAFLVYRDIVEEKNRAAQQETIEQTSTASKSSFNASTRLQHYELCDVEGTPHIPDDCWTVDGVTEHSLEPRKQMENKSKQMDNGSKDSKKIHSQTTELPSVTDDKTITNMTTYVNEPEGQLQYIDELAQNVASAHTATSTGEHFGSSESTADGPKNSTQEAEINTPKVSSQGRSNSDNVTDSTGPSSPDHHHTCPVGNTSCVAVDESSVELKQQKDDELNEDRRVKGSSAAGGGGRDSSDEGIDVDC